MRLASKALRKARPWLNLSALQVGTVIDLASISAASLLSRWPAQQEELLWLLNARIPLELRKVDATLHRYILAPRSFPFV